MFYCQDFYILLQSKKLSIGRLIKIKKFYMSYDEEEIETGFKVGVDEDEPLEMPEVVNDFGLDEEDPDKDR